MNIVSPCREQVAVTPSHLGILFTTLPLPSKADLYIYSYATFQVQFLLPEFEIFGVVLH